MESQTRLSLIGMDSDEMVVYSVLNNLLLEMGKLNWQDGSNINVFVSYF